PRTRATTSPTLRTSSASSRPSARPTPSRVTCCGSATRSSRASTPAASRPRSSPRPPRFSSGPSTRPASWAGLATSPSAPVTPGSHTVVIDVVNTSGTYAAAIDGIMLFDGDGAAPSTTAGGSLNHQTGYGVRMWDAGYAGATVATHINGSGNTSLTGLDMV